MQVCFLEQHDREDKRENIVMVYVLTMPAQCINNDNVT